jgi:hypothetical protein
MIHRTGGAMVVTRRSGVMITGVVAAAFAVFGYTL